MKTDRKRLTKRKTRNRKRGKLKCLGKKGIKEESVVEPKIIF